MLNFEFYTPTRYVFGRGAQLRAGEMTAALLGRKVLVVYGGGSVVRSGLLSQVEESLAANGVEYVELGGIRPNPVDGPVREGVEICRANGVTGILAVGGGSVIDTAKAIAIGVPYEGDFWDFYSGRAKPEVALPVGVVLTIPAAGSEGSGNSVITHEAEKRKISIRTDSVLRPKFALMNPELTYTLPAYQTACGIVDMMAHILERYFSPTEEVVVTDRISEGLLRAIIEEAPKVMAKADDYDARANIMWAGTLAHNGVCGTGRQEDWSSHGLEHEISALYDVAHGAGLAVVFPAYLTYVTEIKPERVAQLARNVLGVVEADDKAAAKEGIARLKDFYRSIGMPVTFAELGVENLDIAEMVRGFHKNKGDVFGAYVPLDSKATEAIYRLAL